MQPEDILKSQVDDSLRLENETQLIHSPRVLVAGLGGSRLAGALLRDMLLEYKIELHSGFDAPRHSAFSGSAMIASSTSGETVETVSAYTSCGELGMSRAVITRGGVLLDAAKRDKVPYVIMPLSPMPPREALVHSLVGHCLLLGRVDVASEIRAAFAGVSIEAVRSEVDRLMHGLQGKSILLYASDEYEALLRYLKVNLNETARIPAYIGLLPETVHGEIAVFEGGIHGPDLASTIAIIQVCSGDTDKRLIARMRALSDVVSAKKILIETVTLPGNGWDSIAFGAVFALMLAHRLREYGSIPRDGENLIGAFKRTMLQYTS